MIILAEFVNKDLQACQNTVPFSEQFFKCLLQYQEAIIWRCASAHVLTRSSSLQIFVDLTLYGGSLSRYTPSKLKHRSARQKRKRGHIHLTKGSFDNHLDKLERVLRRLQRKGLNVNAHITLIHLPVPTTSIL